MRIVTRHHSRTARSRTSFDSNHTQLLECLGQEFEEKLQWDENEYAYCMSTEEQQHEALVQDFQDQNAELQVEANSVR